MSGSLLQIRGRYPERRRVLSVRLVSNSFRDVTNPTRFVHPLEHPSEVPVTLCVFYIRKWKDVVHFEYYPTRFSHPQEYLSDVSVTLCTSYKREDVVRFDCPEGTREGTESLMHDRRIEDRGTDTRDTSHGRPAEWTRAHIPHR